MALALAHPAEAAPDHPLLKQPTVAPVRGEAVPWNPPPLAPVSLDGAAAQDERAIVRYLEANPTKLDVKAMDDPGIARATVELLLRHDRAFIAERLLAQAVEKWPQDPELRRAWARVLLTLGRPAPARKILAKVAEDLPADASTRYLLAKAWLAEEPRTAESDTQAAEALRKVLELAPDYQDPDGVTAPVIMETIKRLAGEKTP